VSKETFRVAALVSLYKAERFIKGRLDDLTNQTLFKRGELEIVIIDSASPENEFKIIRKYREEYPNIKYKRTKLRETLYQAWNRGIEISEAPLLTNANADDRLSPDALEKLASVLEADEAVGFAYGDAHLSSVENETFEEASRGRTYQSQDYFGPDLLCHQFLGHQVMWRRTLHTKVGLFSPEYKAAGDYEFMLRSAVRARGAHVPEPVGLLLRRRDSITFGDGTMNREVALVKEQFRNRTQALNLYRMEGVDIEKPGYPEACYVDLGNRALAYFPQWGGGRPDADFEFALRCYDWALNSDWQGSSTSGIKMWAEANSKCARFLSVGGGSCTGLYNEGKGHEQKRVRGSAAEKRMTLYWPDLGLDVSFEKRSKALGNLSAGESSIDGGLGCRKSHLRPYTYWAQLTGLDQGVVDSLKAQVDANRSVMIWGASDRGRLMSKVLKHFGFRVAGYIDNDPSKIGSHFEEIPVGAFDPRVARAQGWKVVLAVSDQQREFISDQLDESGMREILLNV